MATEGSCGTNDAAADPWTTPPKTSLLVEFENGSVTIEEPSEKNAITTTLGSPVRVTSTILVPVSQTAPEESEPIGSEQTGTQETHASIKVNFQTLQDVENGNTIIPPPSVVAYNGKMTFFVPKFVSSRQQPISVDPGEATSRSTFTHSVNLFFLESGRYRVCVQYSDVKSKRHVARVQYCIVNVMG